MNLSLLHRKHILGTFLNLTDEYRALLTAMDIEPTTRDKIIQNALVVNLKNSGLWDKAEWLHIYATHYGGHKLNWINPSQFNPVFIDNEYTIFQDYIGLRFRNNQYIQTGYIPSVHASKVGLSDICLVSGLTGEDESNNVSIGCLSSGTTLQISPRLSGYHFGYANTLTGASLLASKYTNHYSINRASATHETLGVSGQYKIQSAAVSSLPVVEVYVGATNNNGTPANYTQNRLVYAGVFKALSNEEVTTLNTIIDQYLLNYKTTIINTPDYISKHYIATKKIIPLTTYDGSNMTIHPKVVDTGEVGWNGYRYWMCNTPYPFTNGHYYENPCIWASNDGETFEVPSGVVNPVIPKPETTYNADVSLLFDENKLRLIYKEDPYLMYSESSDGAIWSVPARIKTEDNEDIIGGCTAYFKKGSLYYLYNNSAPFINLMTSATPHGPWSSPVPIIIKYKYYYNNHFDIVYHNNYYYMALGYGTEIYIYRSADGINFNERGNIPVLSWYNKTVSGEAYYRPSFCIVGGYPHLYFSYGGLSVRGTMSMRVDLL